MQAADGLPVISFASAAEWRSWLHENHASAAGVWVSIAKKESGIESVRYPEVLEHAICFGWIDGRRERLDAERFLQRFTPRRTRSPWSRINREKAERLTGEGLMAPAGVEEVRRAKEDGRWERAYASQRTATVPEDLQRELDASPAAAAAFAALSAQNRYAILYRLGQARRPETRARRLVEYVRMLEAGETLHP
ncbi:MAG TPA: YdeI/OmpD-associated family protein [Solirubrobacteraceae bacterium]